MASTIAHRLKDRSFVFLKKYILRANPVKKYQPYYTTVISSLNKPRQSVFCRLFLKHTREPSFSPKSGGLLTLNSNFSNVKSRNISSGNNDQSNKADLRLMIFPEKIWPNLWKTLKNKLFAILIRGYFDPHFSIPNFLKGAEQAVFYVSSLISEGNFDGLKDLVDSRALAELQRSYVLLDSHKKQLIKVNPQDIFFKFIYEIGMIFEDNSERRFVEITAVLHGFVDLKSHFKSPEEFEYDKVNAMAKENVYVCNYRFIREYTKGVQDSWTINLLNHFQPANIAKRSDPFSR